MKEQEKKVVKIIVVRIKEQITVIFEDEFINGNEYRTQNELIECLSLLYNRKDFDVELFLKEI